MTDYTRSSFIILKVQYWGTENLGPTIHVRVKRDRAFKRRFEELCASYHLDKSRHRFRCDGQRINDNDTPRTCSMEDDDSIDIFHEQGGPDVYMTHCPCFDF